MKNIGLKKQLLREVAVLLIMILGDKALSVLLTHINESLINMPKDSPARKNEHFNETRLDLAKRKLKILIELMEMDSHG